MNMSVPFHQGKDTELLIAVTASPRAEAERGENNQNHPSVWVYRECKSKITRKDYKVACLISLFLTFTFFHPLTL